MPKVTLFLAGDVMTGRGLDQILPHPSDPVLYEPYVRSALGYVALAERRHGRIDRPVPFAYPWGDALAELDVRRPDLRIVNLETAVTTSDEAAPKGINYRMHPGNVACLTAAGLDCAVLANNHVLDWGPQGLIETLQVLHDAGLQTCGAGRDREESRLPAVFALSGARVLVFALALPTAGVPPDWAASPGRPGLWWLPDLSPGSADAVARHVLAHRRPGDLAVISIHWGPNWGYEVLPDERAFAHRLVDAGAADLVHGHSAHHPRPLEVYRERAILYGCGDFLNDYEGIGGHEAFRPDLVLAWFVTLGAGGTLADVRMAPFRLRRFRLERAPAADARWMASVLDRECDPLGTAVVLDDGGLRLRW